VIVSCKTVAAPMRRPGLAGLPLRRQTTRVPSAKTVTDLVKRDFRRDGPNQSASYSGWDQSQLAMETAVVEPGDVLRHGEFEITDPLPGASIPYQFGLEQRVERLGHRLIIEIPTDPADATAAASPSYSV
jgi:hypothetical protein